MMTALESAQTELAALVGSARVVTEESARQSLAADGRVPQSVVYPQ